MKMNAVVEARFARINEALNACKECIEEHGFLEAGEYAMQAVNMAGQYAKESNDLADLVREKGFNDSPALPRLAENAELFLDLRGIGLAYYNECVANVNNANGAHGPEDFDLNDPRR